MAFREQFRSGGVMNRSIDSAATEKHRIRRVHNGIHIDLGNIAAGNVDSWIARGWRLSHAR
jgi:hypothetical protein